MRVFVTGGSGFVGSEVLKQLSAAGHDVVALIRQGSEETLPKEDNIRSYVGDVTDPQSLPDGMRGCDAVIHLVGIIRAFPDRGVTFERLHVEATQNVVQAAAAVGVKRYLHMSANGARPDSGIAYQRTKGEAEEAVRKSALEWTIFRPTLIFGPGGEFIEMLGGLVRRLPFVPVFGDGQYRIQPVAVEQVAETYVKALDKTDAINETYLLGGAESYTYDRILDLVGQALGKEKVHKFHQPLSLVKPLVGMLDRFDKFPITEDQLAMLLEGNECDEEPWARALDIDPIAFAQGVYRCFHKKSG
ncbi:MAG: NAD(P)H-binding protein [Desulfuromonadaceae bacterium]